MSGYVHDNSPYMQWYITHTIRYISLVDQSFDDEVGMFYLFVFHNL